MIEVKNKLGIIFFPAYDWAISPTHPERQERLLYTQDQLVEEGVFDITGIHEYKPDIAAIDDIDRVHFSFPDTESILTESHLISAGGAIKAARLVMEKEVDKAFALVRPPGHHAMKVVHGARGFCNVNIEAIMVEYIREHYGTGRIAIVDTDCHHGDGTQDIYWNDPDVLFISIHQDGRTLYPGSGFVEELGGPNALGRTVNIPLPPGTSDAGFITAMEKIVMPLLNEFKPELVINSAGQDNHYSDPITNMNFSAQGYARLNEMLDPDISVLEGGYSIQSALPYVNLGIVLAMAGLDYSSVREPDYDEKIMQADRESSHIIDTVSTQLVNNFKSIKEDNKKQTSGTFASRKKDIFYDTDGIRESQVETVMLCNDCAGLLQVESSSTLNPMCLGVEIPINSCDRCTEEGLKIIDKAKSSGSYDYIQYINRRDKIYERY